MSHALLDQHGIKDDDESIQTQREKTAYVKCEAGETGDDVLTTSHSDILASNVSGIDLGNSGTKESSPDARSHGPLRVSAGLVLTSDTETNPCTPP